MTALKKYERLESTGLWRPAVDQQRREVTVAFGDATLVITDKAERPVAHWSLPAIERVNPGERPAIFAPDAERSETLEVEDDLMIGAIEEVRKHIQRRRPRPGRLRYMGLALSTATVLALGIFWLPGAVTRQTLAVVPATKRAEIGATILGHLQHLTGTVCRDPLGVAALDRLKARLLGVESSAQFVIVPGGLATAKILPGQIVVLNKELVEDYEDPAVVAGHILARITATQTADLLRPVLESGGLSATARLLTTGDLPPEELRAYAEAIVLELPPAPALDPLVANFAAARVSTQPYAYSLDISGETTLDLIESDPMIGQDPQLVLSDREWVALQGICGN